MTTFQFFGRVGDLTGVTTEIIPVPNEVVGTQELRLWIGEHYKNAEGFQDETVRIAIDGELVVEPCQVGSPKEIAFLPPVGGG